VLLPPLYPILDVDAAAASGHDLVQCAAGFASLGLDLQQLRAKSLPGGDMVRLAERLVAVVPRLIINDRADVALLTGAAGVHLGQEDLPLPAARSLKPDWIIGFSTHSPHQAAHVLTQAPDYLAMGPVAETRSKLKPDAVVGVKALSMLKPACTVPLVAIGGITLANCGEAWRAGADAVAVIAGLWGTPDPVAAAERFLLAFRNVSCHN